MDRIEKAAELFERGFNCAQSLLAAYGPSYGVETIAALKLASPLGGGLSRTGGTCGAAMGALLVLGLRHGHVDPDDEAQIDLMREEAREFLRRFGLGRGGTTCPEVLTADMTQPGELERAKEQGLFEEKCPNAVRDAATILEELL